MIDLKGKAIHINFLSVDPYPVFRMFLHVNYLNPVPLNSLGLLGYSYIRPILNKMDLKKTLNGRLLTFLLKKKVIAEVQVSISLS